MVQTEERSWDQLLRAWDNANDIMKDLIENLARTTEEQDEHNHQ